MRRRRLLLVRAAVVLTFGVGTLAVAVPLASASGTVTITAVQGPAIGNAMVPEATEGAPASPSINATFTDTNAVAPGSLDVSVDYGDGTTASTNQGAGADPNLVVTQIGGALGTTYTVTDIHTFPEESGRGSPPATTFTISLTVTEVGHAANADTATGPAQVADAALTGGTVSVASTQNVSFTAVVAHFTDADPNGLVSDYTAIIDWGDATTSTGTVTAASGGGFNVSGSHTYATASQFTVATTITDAGVPIHVTSTATVSAKSVDREFGSDRVATAIAASQATYGTAVAAVGAAHAGAVVLARSDPGQFADALAGGPLAIAKAAPLLLTPSASLDPRVQAEIQRVLGASGTVYLLGGPGALSAGIETALRGLGYTTVRYGGADRFATAVVIADQGLSNPATVFEATGLNFADALGAGPAAGKAHAAILLTNGATQAAATTAYLTAHPADTRYALGGPAAAADPSATALVGATRFETSTLVAGKFFVSPAVVGIASGADYPDALAGGPQLGVLGGPLVLVAPDTLPPVVDTYLRANSTSIASAIVFGGPAAIADVVVAEVESAINNA